VRLCVCLGVCVYPSCQGASSTHAPLRFFCFSLLSHSLAFRNTRGTGSVSAVDLHHTNGNNRQKQLVTKEIMNARSNTSWQNPEMQTHSCYLCSCCCWDWWCCILSTTKQLSTCKEKKRKRSTAKKKKSRALKKKKNSEQTKQHNSINDFSFAEISRRASIRHSCTANHKQKLEIKLLTATAMCVSVCVCMRLCVCICAEGSIAYQHRELPKRRVQSTLSFSSLSCVQQCRFSWFTQLT
jgi:hypothetical protein